MAIYHGTEEDDLADASQSRLVGFTGGTVAQLNDAEGDKFFGGDGADRIIAGDTDDQLFGDSGDDYLDGGDGDDLLVGGLGSDALIGGSGSDTAAYDDDFGSVFVNLTLGRGWNNAAEGDTYDRVEHVRGGLFDDFLIGDAGANQLMGGDGNDVLIGALGADVLDGGAGLDTASYADNQGSVRINLLLGTAEGNSAEGDTLISIENLTGSLSDDILIGDNGRNVLLGGGGNDWLEANGGGDVLLGEEGNDSLASGGGKDLLDGGPGDDILYAIGSVSALSQDMFVGGPGKDTISFEALTPAPIVTEINLATGTAIARYWVTGPGGTVPFAAPNPIGTLVGIENVVGTGSPDQITGNSDDNILEGLGGGDRLNGGFGNDILVGDGGRGKASDTFIFDTPLDPVNNVDFIVDFDDVDRIELHNSIFTGLAFGELNVEAFLIGTSATTPDQRIIYDPASGALYWDADGIGPQDAVQFALLSPGLPLDHSQFFVA